MTVPPTDDGSPQSFFENAKARSAAAKAAPAKQMVGAGFWLVLLVLIAVGGAAGWWTLSRAGGIPSSFGIDRGPDKTQPMPRIAPIPQRSAAQASLSDPDRTALFLADMVNNLRRERARHLLWLDKCKVNGWVESAAAQFSTARTDAERNSAHIICNNLDADVDTHTREAARTGPLLQAQEARLASYIAEHGQSCPRLATPVERFIP